MHNVHTLLTTQFTCRFFVILFAISSLPIHAVVIQNGKMDLRNTSTCNILPLTGPWQYVYGDFMTIDEMHNIPTADRRFAPLPSRWNNHNLYPENLNNHGCMTYYLQLIVDPAQKNKLYGLKIYTVASAYRFYLNNKLVVSKGNPTTTPDGFKANRSGHVTYFKSECDTLHLLLHVSNYTFSNYAGISQPIQFGTVAAIEKHNFNDHSVVFFFSSAFFMLFLLHLLIYILRKYDVSYLLTALISLQFLIKILTENEHILLKLIPMLSPSVEYKLWVLTILIFPLMLSFTKKIYPATIPRLFVSCTHILFLVFTLTIIVMPIQQLTLISHFMVIPIFLGITIMLVLLFKSDNLNSKDFIVYIAALIIMSLTMINDMLYVTDIFRYKLIAHYGGLFFLVTQTGIIVTRYTRTYEQASLLQQTLEITNRNLEDKVSERTLELNTAVKQLEKYNKNQDLILTTLSHDLMNIFNNLSFYSNELLQNSQQTKEQTKDLVRIKKNSENGLSILNLIMEWKNFQDTQSTKPSTIKQLSKILNHELEAFADLMNDKKITVDKDINNDLHFECDYNQLHSIIRNILSNAVKFSSYKGKLSIKNRKADNKVAIEISDNGIGMPCWILDNLFTLRKDKKRTGTAGEVGSGIGLILTKELIDINTGSIHIESDTLSGTTVTIQFPSISSINQKPTNYV
jgi:signal transduction histidine kinase